MAGINRRLLAWVGPEDYEADFAARFYKGMALQGDVFLQASDDDRFDEYTELARGRKYQVDANKLRTMDVDKVFLMMLSPGMMSRVQ